ncbi:unnamed protein product [Kuraishia capsulata CBS 1993]|uniref:1,3-beta-glucan synthase n=1 Tax=Kuraishia capsulata CBS 1993 TaxID=1382522 RepID=W6MN92_9ASCO|nr:uncharacterized protein KUCA_T00003717001 [Kuraishia capsulata CBS 1993]CDK27738.1 unnamed protein product [Kuraishia capsulata CBS 1993]
MATVFGLKLDGSDNKGNFGNGKNSLAEKGINDVFEDFYDPYSSWIDSPEIPITRVQIEAIFIHLRRIFGFQLDSTKNMFDYLMRLLDSRSSRMGPISALKTLHADYIGGINANYRKWYFASQMDIDDSVGFSNTRSNGMLKSSAKHMGQAKANLTLEESERRWLENMASFSPEDCIIQIALYLLIWGEANNIRFMPECLCFIFKCCIDCFYSIDFSQSTQVCSTSFLDHAITPLYDFYFSRCYEMVDGKYIRRDKDHKNIIGYDDMNQLFWYRNGLERIVLKESKTKLMFLPPAERYSQLDKINWEKAFYKTYYESRTWMHACLNFNRVWIIHLCVFWMYTSFNAPTLYTLNYNPSEDNRPPSWATLSAMSLAGTAACIINLISLLAELHFVPRKWPGAEPVIWRFIITFVMFLLNTSPSVYLFVFAAYEESSSLNLAIALLQFVLSLFTVVYTSVVPLGSLLGTTHSSKDRRYLASRFFTNSVHKLQGKTQMISIGLWFCVFLSKFTESYFFLTLSLRDSIRELSQMELTRCAGDQWLGQAFCQFQPSIVLVLLIVTDLILFFLDTYLWYIVWNTFFSVSRSLYIGVSVWTPWKNTFSRLPKRIYSNIVYDKTEGHTKSKALISQVWNSIVISMYREHLLSLEQIHKLIYQDIYLPNGEHSLKEPSFFVSGEDSAMRSGLFESHTEAQRRITFFAQSLSTPMPETTPTDTMPSFSVLIPHYAEKITLSLKEIIREEDEYSNVTLLEYLKHLHPAEWRNFVHDTKLLAEEVDGKQTKLDDRLTSDDLPYYCVGFKSATPEYVLRTRIWASLRSQTLYRTISGFMNYSRAIKLLYDIENPDLSSFDNSESKKLEVASVMAQRKFRMVVSLQRMSEFTPDQQDNREFIMRAFPELQIAYLEENTSPETGETTYYSSLIDGSCDILENGQRKPKYRIKLSGNPVLGDGKSDNQNHALIFCRGEYIQLIDANQDNYLEECLKIKSLLSEFEEDNAPSNPYEGGVGGWNMNPVAIIGTREYIFSENLGILGDIAAGKEQTFGTLFARTLAQVGGKLHYGHPDFLNSIFMTTRGGVSKAQKGLHLNEDIYAGMNAMLRGGRIKHCEYIQCGKGRDLGFGSILNFTTKIGAGMGEQILSRECFYLGAYLPLDRFLSFYYAHPGFHLNNVFILLSVQLFMFFCINLAALTNDSVICEYDKDVPITDMHHPLGCHNLIPVVLWLKRCVLSIFIVFAVSFVPLCVQELTERGIWRATARLTKQFASFSPLFETFVCRVYSQALINDMSLGGAKYIATERGFSTIRASFPLLYSRYSHESIYFAATLFLMLLYSSIAMWNFSLVYFWIIVCALSLPPFIFNPNQLSFSEFFLDYGNFRKWMSGGSVRWRPDSWIGHVRKTRMQVTGSKRKANKSGDLPSLDFKRPSFINSIFDILFSHLVSTILVFIAYLFANSQNDSRAEFTANTTLRLIICSVSPIILNTVVLLLLQPLSIVIAPVISWCWSSFPSILARIAHGFAVICHLFFFELLWFSQNWDVSRTILGLCCCIMIQSLILKVLTVIFLTREMKHDRSNRAWWSGKWATAELGWGVLTQPSREFVCKITEMSLFATDFVLGHFLLFVQFPLLFIPGISMWHSTMLFWLKPHSQVRSPMLNRKQRGHRRRAVQYNLFMFLMAMAIAIALFVVPLVLVKVCGIDLDDFVPEFFFMFKQPYTPPDNRKGLKNYVKPKTHA